MSRLVRTIANLGALITLLFAMPLSTVAVASASSSPDIIDNLCAGANLKEGTSCKSGGGDAADAFNKVIKLIINTISLVVGIVAVVMIIIGGMRYITSSGSDSNVTSAKNTILYAVIGLIIVAMAQVIIRFVLNKLASG